MQRALAWAAIRAEAVAYVKRRGSSKADKGLGKLSDAQRGRQVRTQRTQRIQRTRVLRQRTRVLRQRTRVLSATHVRARYRTATGSQLCIRRCQLTLSGLPAGTTRCLLAETTARLCLHRMHPHGRQLLPKHSLHARKKPTHPRCPNSCPHLFRVHSTAHSVVSIPPESKPLNHLSCCCDFLPCKSKSKGGKPQHSSLAKVRGSNH